MTTMTNTKTEPKKKKKSKSNSIFAPKNVWENFKQIRWLPLKRSKDGKDGLIQVFGKVMVLIVATALAFVLIDLLFSLVTTAVTSVV